MHGAFPSCIVYLDELLCFGKFAGWVVDGGVVESAKEKCIVFFVEDLAESTFVGVDHGDAAEDHVRWEGVEHGLFDVEAILNHDYDGVAWGYGWCYERSEGWWDVGKVFGCGDNVVEWREGFFDYVWY